MSPGPSPALSILGTQCKTSLKQKEELIVLDYLSTCLQLKAGGEGDNSPTRDQTRVPCFGRWILNCWTTREVARQQLDVPLLSLHPEPKEVLSEHTIQKQLIEKKFGAMTEK